MATEKTTFITFDLETTGLRNEVEKTFPHITEIAAMEMETSQLFSTYVLPKKPIEQEAEELTGIVVNGNTMKVRGETVDPASIEDALKKLFEWLDNFSNVVLVAHFGLDFDFQVMFSALNNTNNADEFLKRVTGLIDSLPLFREKFPGQSSYKHLDLAQSLLDKRVVHNATNKAETLVDLVKKTNLSSELLLSRSVSPKKFHEKFMAQINV